MFRLNDLCHPATFSGCTGCSQAQCVYHKFEHSNLSLLLQVYNLAMLVWLVLCVQSSASMVVAGTLGRHMAGDWRGDMTCVEVRTSWKIVCRHHLGTVVVVSLLPRICQCGYVITAVHGDSA